jgi:putative phosphoesterase
MGAVVKVAVLSDIHGNLPALQSVLADMPSVDTVVCCGDLVGYYPDAEQVCNAMRDLDAYIVRGNHEGYVAGALTPANDKIQAYKVEWTRTNLSQKNLSWLASLPVEKNLSLDGIKIKVRHASPWDEETYLYPDSARLSEIHLTQDEWLWVGHTHRPLSIQVGDGMLLNPGSVGQPRDWNPLASYAIFDTVTRQAVIRRVVYNVRAFQNRLKELGWESSLIEILSRRNDRSEL